MLLDVTHRRIVIVGGGGVAVRKARGLLAAGARNVVCVAPRIAGEMPAEVDRVDEAFDERHLEGAELVFAATDSALVNDRVVKAARDRGAFVNRADSDDGAPGDFATPATHRESALMIMVSAAGSPALAATVRDDLAAKLNPAHVRLAAQTQRLRPLLRDTAGLSIERRREVFRDLAGSEAAGVMEAGGEAALLGWLRARYPELTKVL